MLIHELGTFLPPLVGTIMLQLPLISQRHLIRSYLAYTRMAGQNFGSIDQSQLRQDTADWWTNCQVSPTSPHNV
ncbi:MAG: hypothetical protein GY820_18745 [Gammaproteobacteria bacterium]|nr:hypothetical protein [Gammaproteobacteria bacterium]